MGLSRGTNSSGIALRGGGAVKDDDRMDNKINDGEYFGMDHGSEVEELYEEFQRLAADRERQLKKYQAQKEGKDVNEESDEEKSKSQPPRQRDPVELLPEGEYKLLQPDPHHKRKIEVLGIDESLVAPADIPSSSSSSSWWRGWLGGGGHRSLSQLQHSEATWRPTQMRFVMQWPDDEMPSKWFEILYVHLYVRVARFAERYIEFEDIEDEYDQGSGYVWAAAATGLFSKQFIYYAGLVARQDNMAGGWDCLITSKLHRKYLVMGVIAKVLETSVFDKLLFGASEAQLDVLSAEDEATLDVDGYLRTALRSRSVRLMMSGETLTPFFWEDVDLLTMQLIRLLLPLIELLDKHFDKSLDNSLRSIYQDLHHIVAEAAYLSIAIRWSKNIFRFSTPLPGQPWDMDQAHVDDTIYNLSRERVTEQDKIDEQEWTENRKDGKEDQEADSTPGILSRLSARVRAVPAWAKNKAVNGLTWTGLVSLPVYRHKPPVVIGSDFWYPPSRIAKVQIVLWPMLQRYVTVGELGDNPAAEAPEGENITTIFNSQVVYYVGKIDAIEEQAETVPTLQQWVRHKTRERFWRVGFLFQVLPLVIFSGFAGELLYRYYMLPGGGVTAEVVNDFYGLMGYCVQWAQHLFDSASSAMFGLWEFVIGVFYTIYGTVLSWIGS
ncbi:hypothetical protein B0T19DRAFT_396477 [Cercophora scortea]|uniref:Uncharacterized protein n=1 Tax=Cercophora scortea TaxID=314031 RepID=A0AAE0ML97_9PEZI|nr:hypothetical protein B0T19DRAFT_396477 [Cercophora scortea]